MSKEPNRNVYVGHRYVPKIMGEWDNSKQYEGLCIVTYQGTSYTSKKRVPVGIDILNEEFWTVTGNYDAQVEHYRQETNRVSEALEEKADIQDFIDFENEINDDINTYKQNTDNTLDRMQNDINDRGVNLKSIGFLLDGTDETDKVMNAFQEHQHLIHPGGVLGVSDTFKIPNGCSLTGANDNIREVFNDTTPVIKYIGEINRLKTVVLIGQNDVGEEPEKDASNIRFKNIMVDCNYRAGFGVYGTYLTNETTIDNISVIGSLEYNFYFARGWYATLRNLTSQFCKGKGIALGMPLELQDGTKINWSIFAPLELNNVLINNVRSMRAGEYYSDDNNGLFDPYDTAHRRHGYGIGAGIGNSFNLKDFLSEGSGGTDLYVYNGFQPMKILRNGYLEGSGRGSGLNPTEDKPAMIIENTSALGDVITINDIFINYGAGGIFHVGEKRRVQLNNIYQPRFLKSLDGLERIELYSFILKNSVYHGAGTHNTLEEKADRIDIEVVNTRYSFEVKGPAIPGGETYIYFKKLDDNDLYGGYNVNLVDGRTYQYPFPEDINETNYTLGRSVGGAVKSVTKSGGTGDIDAEVSIKIVKFNTTAY